MNYKNIRKLIYKNRLKISNIATPKKKRNMARVEISDMKNWRKMPYTALKTTIFHEISVVLVFLLQYVPIQPNWISLAYAASSLIACILLSSGVDNMILTGLVIIFFKSILDWLDGDIARLRKQTSELGDLLDAWAGQVGYYSFLIGLGMYLFNATQEIHFIYVMILIMMIKSLDLKDYTYHRIMYSFYKKNTLPQKIKNKGKKITQKKNNIPNTLIILKNFFQNFLDNRARTIDFICLIILIELIYDQIIFTNFIYYLILFKLFIVFLGGFYLVYFKNFIEKISSKKN